MNSISTIIRKLISVLIAGLSVIVLTLSNSLSAFVAPSAISSPMSEPVSSTVNSQGIKTSVYYMVIYLDGGFGQWEQYNGKYLLFRHEVSYPSTTEFVIANWTQSAGYPIFSNNQGLRWSFSMFDIETGTLLREQDLSDINVISYNWGPYSNNYIINYTGFSYFPFGSARYYINGDIDIYGTSGTYTVEPFVTWSILTPEHNKYHSHLSEPVADKYNRYFIIDDKLYWVSFRINGAYVLTSDVLTEQEVESYTSSGEYLGVISSTSNSLISIGSQTTYKDMEVYPVNIKSEQFFDDELVYLSIYYNSSGADLRLNIDRLGLIRALSTDRLYIETELYYSVFNLEDGSYIESKYFENDGFVTSHLSLNAGLPDTIADIKCYGIAFLNAANLPVNLSDILWEYDLEFAEWRDRLESMLVNIYKSLTGEEVETEIYTQPSWNDEINQAEPNTYISQDEMISVFDSGFDDIKPSPENQLSITHWVDMFSIPKLIAACCFALAMGTIILTLGKKKSD